MKVASVIPGLALAFSAHAQVIECPKQYPADGAPREQHVSIKPAPLDNASVYVDELFGAGLLQGKRTDGKRTIEYGFAPDERKWLVCRYGTLEWWRELDHAVTRCALQTSGDKRGEMAAKLTCR